MQQVTIVFLLGAFPHTKTRKFPSMTFSAEQVEKAEFLLAKLAFTLPKLPLTKSAHWYR